MTVINPSQRREADKLRQDIYDNKRESITLEEANILIEAKQGFLNLAYSNIKSLPEGMLVPCGLLLKNAPIAELPRGLVVGGCIDLTGTNVCSIPEDIRASDIRTRKESLKTQCAELSHTAQFKQYETIGDNYIFSGGRLHTYSEVHKKGDFTAYLVGGSFWVVTDGETHLVCRDLDEGMAKCDASLITKDFPEGFLQRNTHKLGHSHFFEWSVLDELVKAWARKMFRAEAIMERDGDSAYISLGDIPESGSASVLDLVKKLSDEDLEECDEEEILSGNCSLSSTVSHKILAHLLHYAKLIEGVHPPKMHIANEYGVVFFENCFCEDALPSVADTFVHI